jgi:hypothetical protein
VVLDELGEFIHVLLFVLLHPLSELPATFAVGGIALVVILDPPQAGVLLDRLAH